MKLRTLFTTTLIMTLLLSTTSAYGGDGTINLLGEQAQQTVSTSSSVGAFNPVKRRISTISGPDGIREANFNLYTQDSKPYINPGDFGQVFQGSQMTENNGQFIVQRPNGGQLTFIIVLQQMIILFLGAQAETGVPVYQQNGQTFIPLNQMGQFYGQQFSQTGSQLVNTPSNETPQWLQTSWQNTLSQNGALDYQQQISSASNYSSGNQSTGTQPGQNQVFRDITATVFSSRESRQGGAYGEWLREDDLYVALPKKIRRQKTVGCSSGTSRNP